MNEEITKVTPLGFDELYLSPPESRGELREMREDHSLLLTNEVEDFCRHIVIRGKLPLIAYELAFTKEIDGQLVRPDHAAYHSKALLRKHEVVARIKELRDDIITAGRIEREEIILTLKGIALDEHNKNADRIAAAAQLAKLEAFNKEPDTAPQGATLTLVLPFVPRELTSAPPPKLVEGEVVE